MKHDMIFYPKVELEETHWSTARLMQTGRVYRTNTYRVRATARFFSTTSKYFPS